MLLLNHFLYRHFLLSSLDNTYIKTALTRPTVSFGSGYNELASKEPTPILDFLKNFWGPMPIMIWIAIIVEIIPKPEADHELRPSWADFGVLLTLQLVNGFVGWYEHMKAGDAVAALKNSLSPKANVKRNGQWLSIPGRELVPGDLVSLAIGGAVPADW